MDRVDELEFDRSAPPIWAVIGAIMSDVTDEQLATIPVADRRCKCGHIENHHGSIDNTCGETPCACRRFTTETATRKPRGDDPGPTQRRKQPHRG